MKEPRNLEDYTDAHSAAAFLMSMACRIMGQAEAHPRVKIKVQFWNWNPEWQDTPKKKGVRRGGPGHQKVLDSAVN